MFRFGIVLALMCSSVSALAEGEAAPAVIPTPITDKDMITDRAQKITADGEQIVFIDYQGRLLTSKVDGTGRKVLTATGSGANDRVLAMARESSEFALVTEGAATYVYFQGRENPTSFKAFFYKVNLNGSGKPVPLFRIVRPFTHVIPSPKGDQIYLAGTKHSLLNVASGATTELPVQPVYSNLFTLSSDFRWVIYAAQVSRTPGQPPSYELRSFDLTTKHERTLLQDLDRFHLTTEVSAELGLVAVFRSTGGSAELLLISLEGNELRRVYPLPGSQVPIQAGQIFFLKGIRGEGDAGRLMFSLRERNVSRLLAADLNDLNIEKIPTGEVEGEEITGFRVTPDSKTLLFQRGIANFNPEFPEHHSLNEGKFYSLDLAKPDAKPIFVYQSNHGASSLTTSGAAVVYISSGSFFPVNELILATLDGRKSVRVSEGFTPGWLKAGESLSSLATAGTRGIVSVQNVQGQPLGQYRLLSFLIDEKSIR